MLVREETSSVAVFLAAIQHLEFGQEENLKFWRCLPLLQSLLVLSKQLPTLLPNLMRKLRPAKHQAATAAAADEKILIINKSIPIKTEVEEGKKGQL